MFSPRRTGARGGAVLHHADDHGPGGEASGIPDQAVLGTLAGERIPGLLAVWPNPSSHWRQGPRRSNWCWAACAEAGRPTARREASERSTTGSWRTAEGGMAALRPRNRNAGQANKPAPRRSRNAGAGCDDAEALRRQGRGAGAGGTRRRGRWWRSRRKRPGRRPAAPVEQGEDAAGRPSASGVFTQLDDMLARHRAEQDDARILAHFRIPALSVRGHGPRPVYDFHSPKQKTAIGSQETEP